MPRTKSVTREKIIAGAVEQIRRFGFEGLNARSLSAQMNCSTQPLYREFKNMEELKTALLKESYRLYEEFVAREMASGKYPAYKSYGIAYFCFAKEETELFRFLFLRPRVKGKTDWEDETLRPIIEQIALSTGLSEESAMTLHFELWGLVHGLATQVATGYLDWEIETVSDLLTVAYQGVKNVLCQKEGV